MDDSDAMYAAGRARQGGMAAPKGGGSGNGGRLVNQAYARGGRVDGGAGTAAPAPAAPGGLIGGADRRLAAQQAGKSVGRKTGGRVGKGC
jgi:hypothetical protein